MNDDSLKDLEREMAHYMAELSWMPMKFEAHLGRFVIHAAVLGQMYKLTDQELASVVQYARKCHVVATEVPGASGKPN